LLRNEHQAYVVILNGFPRTVFTPGWCTELSVTFQISSSKKD